MKQIGVIGIIGILIVSIVIVSGCTSSGDTQTPKEQLVGTYNISEIKNGEVFGDKKLIVPLPANNTKVRVQYVLKAESNYDMGSNGNLGTTDDTIPKNSGQSLSTFFGDNKYLEGGAGEKIHGELNLTQGNTFYYEGNFASGAIRVYATV